MTNLIKGKEIGGATYEDAATPARYAGLQPNMVG
jgi:hypothetical protein